MEWYTLNLYSMNPSLYMAGRAWKVLLLGKDDSCESLWSSTWSFIYRNYPCLLSISVICFPFKGLPSLRTLLSLHVIPLLFLYSLFPSSTPLSRQVLPFPSRGVSPYNVLPFSSLFGLPFGPMMNNLKTAGTQSLKPAMYTVYSIYC